MLRGKKGVVPYALAGGLFLAFVAVVLIASGTTPNVNLPGTGSGSGEKLARDISCDVTVKEKLVGAGVYIDESRCYVSKVRNSCSGFSLSIVALPWIIQNIDADQGTLQLLDSRGVLDTKNFDTGTKLGPVTLGTGDSDLVTLKGCTEDAKITIRAFGEDGNRQDQTQVNVR